MSASDNGPDFITDSRGVTVGREQREAAARGRRGAQMYRDASWIAFMRVRAISFMIAALCQ